MKRYVIGDLHGNLKALKQCLQGIEFDYENDLLIQLGDVVDRMPESFGCVEELLKIKNLISIKGNHDDWFFTWLKTEKHPANWQHGGNNALQSYCYAYDKDFMPTMNGYKTTLHPENISFEHFEFFNKQLDYYILDKKLFVHGGFNRHFKINEQQVPDIFYWDRDLWMSALSFQSVYEHNKIKLGTPDIELKFKIVDKSFDEIFIGHTPTINWENLDGTPRTHPMNAGPIWNIDTGGGFEGGRVTIMDIDEKTYNR